jgi:hypothetical protein
VGPSRRDRTGDLVRSYFHGNICRSLIGSKMPESIKMGQSLDVQNALDDRDPRSSPSTRLTRLHGPSDRQASGSTRRYRRFKNPACHWTADALDATGAAAGFSRLPGWRYHNTPAIESLPTGRRSSRPHQNDIVPAGMAENWVCHKGTILSLREG